MGGLSSTRRGQPSRLASQNPLRSRRPRRLQLFIASSRISTVGMMIFALYGQENLAAVDTVLAVMGLCVGVMDGYLCWREGRPRTGMLRSACAFVVAAVRIARWPADSWG